MRLYITKHMATREIGRIYNVRHITVRRWLQDYNIPARLPGYGLAHQEKPIPAKKDLYRLHILEYKTSNEIGQVYGISAPAVNQWLKKYNIPHHTRSESVWKGARPVISKDELQELYSAGMSTTAIGDLYNVTPSFIQNTLREYDIHIRKPGFNNGMRYLGDDNHEVRSLYELKVDNWLTSHGIDHIYEPKLPDKKSKSDFLANGWYIEIWGVDSETYRKRKTYKRTLYAAFNLPLIEIGSYCFATKRNGAWERKLMQCLTAPNFTINESESLLNLPLY